MRKLKPIILFPLAFALGLAGSAVAFPGARVAVYGAYCKLTGCTITGAATVNGTLTAGSTLDARTSIINGGAANGGAVYVNDNMGVGTTSAPNKLTVDDGIELIGDTFLGTGSGFYQQATNRISTVTGGSGRFWVDANGNIGTGGAAVVAGTSAAGAFVMSSGTAPTDSPADAVQTWSADRGGTAGKAGLHIRSEDGTSHVFSDRVGIGTTTPADTLDLNGAQLISANSDFAGSPGGFRLFKMADNGSCIQGWAGSSRNLTILTPAGQHLLTNPAGTNNVHLNPSIGGTCIGSTTAPANKLDVAGGISIGAGYVGTTAPTNGLIVQGIVGIGTTTPTTTLDVAGAIKIGTLDTCNSTREGSIRYTTGTPGTFEGCRKDTPGTGYEWVQLNN